MPLQSPQIDGWCNENCHKFDTGLVLLDTQVRHDVCMHRNPSFGFSSCISCARTVLTARWVNGPAHVPQEHRHEYTELHAEFVKIMEALMEKVPCLRPACPAQPPVPAAGHCHDYLSSPRRR